MPKPRMRIPGYSMKNFDLILHRKLFLVDCVTYNMFRALERRTWEIEVGILRKI